MKIIVVQQGTNNLIVENREEDKRITVCIVDDEIGLSVDLTIGQIQKLKKALDICVAQARNN